VTSEQLLPWIGSGFLASGAAATDDVVEEAALPFDRRRHGMLLGMGAAALVIESAAAARERAITPICEVLATATANSAFHGTRLDVEHIGQVMEGVVSRAEKRGVRREEIAPELMFVSHETYTPARGGSAAAEIHALRQVFGDQADQIVIANTKGLTGHPMGVGIEDIVAIKALETGIVPPVPNFRDVDPELGELNLSRGGIYPVRYALRLAAGFGSQISMTLMRWTPVADRVHRSPDQLGYAYRITNQEAWTAWMRSVSGQEDPQLEVVSRTLRVVDPRTEARAVAAGPPEPVAAPEPPPLPAVPKLAAVPEPAPAPAAAATSSSEDAITERVLQVVAQQTGYPTDLLDPDLDLEADLGIDTVKQAEVFAAIREAYGIERDDALKLRDYPTLRSVVEFVIERSPQVAESPAEPEPEPAPLPEAAAPGTSSEDEITQKVLDVVAQQTGYPTDLLDPDLDLEADLGIDTVKQAEVFAAIREAYGIERDDALRLRDYPTLRSVVEFVIERSPQVAESEPARESAPEPEPPVAPAPAANSEDAITQKVLDVVAEQTGYPTDLLDPDLDLEADLGIDTVKQAEVFAAIREAYGIERDDALKLRDYPTLRSVVQFVMERSPQVAEPEAAPQPEPASKAAPEQPEPEDPGRFPRRVPVAVLRPPLDCCVPTGVELAAEQRVVLMPDHGGVATALAG
ncbi:MAG: phosphopantetheine-binding protein, partial [Solirubrobacteraceae bacterium]